MALYLRVKASDTSANLAARGFDTDLLSFTATDVVVGFGDEADGLAGNPLWNNDFVVQFSTAVRKLANYARDKSYPATATTVWHYACSMRDTKGTPIIEGATVAPVAGHASLIIGAQFHGADRTGDIAGTKAYWSSTIVDTAIRKAEHYIRNWWLAGNDGNFL